MKILFLSFMGEDIGVAMVTNMIFLFFIRILTFGRENISIMSLFVPYNFISEFHNIFVMGILQYR